MAKSNQPTLDLLESPTVHRGRERKRAVRVEGTGEAGKAIGQISKNCEIFGFTKGQFSLTDIILHVLETTGPADVIVSTWTAAHADIQTHHRLLASGRVRSMRWIVDRSFPARQPEYCKLLVDKFGPECIRLTRTHAKFVVVRNEGWAIVIRTSMNLNSNPRFENFEISEDREFAAFFESIADEVFSRVACGIELSCHELDEAFAKMLGGGDVPTPDPVKIPEKPERRSRMDIARSRV